MADDESQASNHKWCTNAFAFVLPLMVVISGTSGWLHALLALATIMLVAGIYECICNRPEIMLKFLSRMLAKQSYSRRLSGPKFVTAGDFTFCYCESGQQFVQSPSVLFLHGTGESKFSWSNVVQHMSKHHHIVLLDLPGYGGTTCNPAYSYSYKSQADRIGQFILLTGLWKRPFHLVGYSTGGTIAALYAMKRQEDVARLTIINPTGVTEDKLSAYGTEDSGYPLQIASAHILPQEFFLPANVYKVIRRRYSSVQDVVQKTIADNEPSQDRLLLAETLQHITSPVQIILCSKELRSASLSTFESHISGCDIEVHILDECGARVRDENPDLLAKMIAIF